MVCLCPVSKDRFGYALANGIVGLYGGSVRLWRIKVRNHGISGPTSLCADICTQVCLICMYTYVYLVLHVEAPFLFNGGSLALNVFASISCTYIKVHNDVGPGMAYFKCSK